METFKIKISKQLPSYEGNVNIEFAPDQCPEFVDKGYVSDFVLESEVTNPTYIESKRVELYNILDEIFGADFTSKYSL